MSTETAGEGLVMLQDRRLSRATAQLKELRRRRSEERLSGFHAAFYRAARAALPAKQLTTPENEAAAAVGR